LPLAEVYRYDGPQMWTNTGRLDPTPNVRYRRAWSMAVYDGRLFCGTLPSGRVHAMTAGQCVTFDEELDQRRHHVAAVREGGRLKLYVDGKLKAQSPTVVDPPLDVDCKALLEFGRGTTGDFQGKASLQLYRGALSDSKIAELANSKPPAE
jgi:hypothetical protein